MISAPETFVQVSDDLEDAQSRAEGLIDQVVDALPRIGIAVGVVIVFWGISRIARSLRSQPDSLSRTSSPTCFPVCC